MRTFLHISLTALCVLAAVSSCVSSALPDEGRQEVYFRLDAVPSFEGVSACGPAVRDVSSGLGALLSRSSLDGYPCVKSAERTSLEGLGAWMCAYRYVPGSTWAEVRESLPPVVSFSNRTVRFSSGSGFLDGEPFFTDGMNRMAFLGLGPAEAVTPAGTVTGSPRYAFAAESDPARQVDLLECVCEDYLSSNSLGGVPLRLRHVLSGIRVKAEDFGAEVRLTGVALEGLSGSAVRRVGIGWEGYGPAVEFYSPAGLTVPASGAVDLVSGDGTFMVIPQVCPAGSSLRVDLECGARTASLCVPLGGTVLEEGCMYLFSLSLDLSDITVRWLLGV